MSQQLREDGTVPLRRKIQLVLRMTGDKPVEVVRNIKPVWTAGKAEGMTPAELVIAADGFEADPREEMLGIVARDLREEVTVEVLVAMLRELIARVSS